MSWKLKEWNESYNDMSKPTMTQEEINAAIIYLRENNYPKPEDCPALDCPKVRPACSLGRCQIAAGMCGDF